MKKCFNFRLYREGLRQLKLIGWMAFLIYMLEAVLIPIQTVLQRHSIYDTEQFITESAVSMHPLMLTVFLVVAPLMMLYLFNFMNKRSGCDFYHAVPDTRTTMFLSFTAAILTWCLFLIISGFSAAVLFRLCFGYLFRTYMDWIGILKFMLALCVSSLFMCGLTALAMSVTGTTFTNVLVTLMVLFVPRSLITIISSGVSGMLPFVEDSGSTSLTNWAYNIPLGSFQMVFSARSSVWCEWGSILYTLVVGAIYLVAAWLLFRVRKSETAGKSAPNRALQCVFRLIIPSLISIAVTISLFSDTEGGSFLPSDWFTYVILYIVAIVAYLLYELMTTRKWRNVARSLPGLLILVGINLAAFGGASLSYNNQIRFQPAAGTLVSVQCVGNPNSSDYFEHILNQAAFTDTQLCDAVAADITEKTQLWQQSHSQYYRKISDEGVSAQVFRVTDRSGRTWERRVWLTKEEQEHLSTLYYSNETLRTQLQQLPEVSGVSFGDISNQETAKQLYEMLKQEVAEMDFADWYDLLLGNDKNPIVIVSSNLVTSSGTYYMVIPVDAVFFPKTNEHYYASLYAEQEDDRKKEIEILNDFTVSNENFLTIHFYAQDTKDSLIEYEFESNTIASSKFSDFQRAISEILQNAQPPKAGIQSNYIFVGVYCGQNVHENGENYYIDTENYNVCFALNDQELGKIKEIYKMAYGNAM